MGGGSWTRDSFTSYTVSKGYDVALDGAVMGFTSNVQDNFKNRMLAAELDPKNVIRECVDTAEHPNTKPVILALDVTGSMGKSAMEVAKQINVVMTKLYESITDVEFLVMGIGDLDYDRAPIQASQFESDIRIAVQLDKVYFEGGGGGNTFESYTAAWYFGARHTKLDCWKRGQKGVIITMGDEPLNPYLPKARLSSVTGDNLQSDIETAELYKEASEKFDIYHLNVEHRGSYWRDTIHQTFSKYLDDKHLKDTTVNQIANDIVEIVTNAFANGNTNSNVVVNNSEGISW
jgi:hypothetical protein